jgi:hypothetical protein
VEHTRKYAAERDANALSRSIVISPFIKNMGISVVNINTTGIKYSFKRFPALTFIINKIIKLNITKFIIKTVFSFVINKNTSTPADKINFSRGLTSLRELA